MLFTAYAIVRTVPSANRPNRREKKNHSRNDANPARQANPPNHRPCPLLFDFRSANFSTGQMIFTAPPHALSRPRLQYGACQLNALRRYVYLQTSRHWFSGMERPTPIKDAAVHRLAKSITQLILCQVTTSEVDDATKLLEKARQKLQGSKNIPSQRVIDLEATICQLRQIGCILDSCTISASCKVTQAHRALLQLHHTARRASTSSEELNAQISPRTDDEYNLPYHEDELQEH